MKTQKLILTLRNQKLMSKPNEMQVDAQSIYHELQHDFSGHCSDCVLMSHFGEFSHDLANSLSESLESMMHVRDVKRIIIKRMFSIMIEGLQNIRLHGEKDHLNKRIGHVMIVGKDHDYSVSFGNIVNAEAKANLSNLLCRINNLELPELKDYYLDVLANGDRTDKGGAGLGFTTIALKSKSKINYQFIEMEENTCYFEIRVNIF